MSNELVCHSGVKGMRWGIRRYQNKDGTLTDTGKKRYDRDIKENLSKKKDNRIDTSKPDANRWVKEDLTRSKKLVDIGSDVVNQANRINRDVNKSKKQKLDLSKMTDQQLRDRINRTNLEKQYNEMFAPPETVSKGKKYLSNVLEVGGSALAVGSSALGIALAIKELRG